MVAFDRQSSSTSQHSLLTLPRTAVRPTRSPHPLMAQLTPPVQPPEYLPTPRFQQRETATGEEEDEEGFLYKVDEHLDKETWVREDNEGNVDGVEVPLDDSYDLLHPDLEFRGFREGRSTADVTQVIVRMKEDADDYAKRVGRTGGEARDENDRMVARLLDLEKAYPRVSKPALWMLLERYGLTGCLQGSKVVICSKK